MRQGPTRRVAVVSGGSSGIGFATVTRLLEEGYNVAFFSQNAAHVEQAAEDLRRLFEDDRIHHACVDLRDPEAIHGFFGAVEARWQAVDTIICNAGISPKGPDGATPFETMTLEEWTDVLTVNLTGAMICCQMSLRSMKRFGFGRIILVSSIAGRSIPKIAGTAYAVSKTALAGLARPLVANCAGTNITVNVVAPGRVVTAMSGDADGAKNQAALQRIPVGRLGSPEDVAATIAFLASKEAGFINGATIDINGGEFAPL